MTLRVGVVGAGVIGEDHARRLDQRVTGARLAGVADVDRGRASRLAASVPGAIAYPSGHDLIGAPEIDAVAVTTWGATHEEYVLAAIAAGKPVFCEKPLAEAADACLRIVDAEVSAGRRLVQVGFMRRYDAGYLAMKRGLDDGLIGAPLLVHCAHRNPDVPEHYTTDMPISDTAVHEVDTMRWLLGEEIVAITVLLPRRNRRAAAHLADPQVLLLETSNGTLIDVEVNVNCAYGYDIRCELVGETGTLLLDNPAGCTVRHSGAASQQIPAGWRVRFGAAYDAELQQWADSLASGEAAGASSWDGYEATAVCEAGLAALRERERIAIAVKDRPSLYGSALAPPGRDSLRPQTRHEDLRLSLSIDVLTS
jgi:myo-inositol 2-dehydrogenase / D-chiro-inositol 1-dehydrogenase